MHSFNQATAELLTTICFVMRRIYVFIAVLAVAASMTAASDPVASLNQSLAGQIVTIRDFPTDVLLRYDPDGRLLQGVPNGPWTVFGEFQFGNASLKNRTLRITGQRLAVLFPNHDLTRKYYRLGQTTIEIEFPQPPDAAAVNHAINHIFVGGGTTLAQVVQACWRPLLNGEITPKPPVKREKHPKQPPNAASAFVEGPQPGEQIKPGVYRVGKDVKPPKATSTPEPVYEPIARAARIEGITVLQAVVDEHGQLEDVAVVTPLGFGLDERACEALARWKFAPATKSGVPVKVAINVEVNFHLY